MSTVCEACVANGVIKYQNYIIFANNTNVLHVESIGCTLFVSCLNALDTATWVLTQMGALTM